MPSFRSTTTRRPSGERTTARQHHDTGHIHVGKGLNTGALGVVGSTVIGLASTAPLYSLAATLGWVILAIGPQAPVAFLFAAVPMIFAALAYQELNREMPDCGTTFVWGTKAFGPIVGWIGGWAVAVSAVMVLANVAEISGQYLWYLVGNDEFANDPVIVVASGVAFIAVMTFISLIGVQIGEKLQMTMMVIQYAALALFGTFAFLGALNGSSPSAVEFEWSWFDPTAMGSWSGFVQAVLLCLFIYWGWDTCLALNEETKDPRRTPGRSALATILPTARGTLSMAVYGALPAKFASVHPRFKTPWFSTTVMGIAAIVYSVVMSMIAESVLADSITSMGLAVALYYAITSFACVWYFRDTLRDSARNLWMRGILPMLGGLMLTYAFIQSAIDMISTDYSETVLLGVGGAFVIGVGSLGLGFVLIGLWALNPASRPFFRSESLNRVTPVLVPEE